MRFDYIISQPHLFSIELVQRMVKMYSRYRYEADEEVKYLNGEDATRNPGLNAWVYDKFSADLDVDPVLRFTDYVVSKRKDTMIPGYSEEEGKMAEIQNIERFIAHTFYLAKGTEEILEKTKSIFGFEYIGDITYTNSSLNFKISGTSLSWVDDEEKFINYFSDFLKELIFINKEGSELLENIDTYNLEFTININETINTNIESSIQAFRILEVTVQQ